MEIGIILTIIFVVLRLTGVIHWSWWWVFAPLWIGAIIIGIMWATAGIGWLFITARGKLRRETVELEKPLIEAQAERKRKSNAFGTWSLVLGIVGFFWWPAVLGIIALVLAILQFRRHVSKRSIAGLTLGIVDITLAFIWYSVGLMPTIF